MLENGSTQMEIEWEGLAELSEGEWQQTLARLSRLQAGTAERLEASIRAYPRPRNSVEAQVAVRSGTRWLAIRRSAADTSAALAEALSAVEWWLLSWRDPLPELPF